MFQDDFIWGVASSAYQIEGAFDQDGRGESVWDRFSKTPGKCFEGQNGDIACDHYSRYKEDVALMKEIGVKAYRFSVCWPRILPDGIGKVNEKGLDFYESLVDELVCNGIEPYLNLFHWDYPYKLYERGGWLERDSVDWFTEYTQAVVGRLAGKVSNWMTLNEPQCFIGQGHSDGFQAPGDKLGMTEVLKVGHHSLLAHGRAVQVIRDGVGSRAFIGYAPVGVVKVPVSDSQDDIDAARKKMFSFEEPYYWNNTWWIDPVFLGKYPEDGLIKFEKYLPDIRPGDMETIAQPIDYCGANIYHAEYIKMEDTKPVVAPYSVGQARTTVGWPVVPECLYWGPKFLYERYGKPIIVTENGMANTDWPDIDGKVHDPQRVDFVKRHLMELNKVVDEGLDVRGYFYWSIMDNYEWELGYTKRFGLVYIDYESQKRTMKDSAHWYKNVISSNGKL